MTTPPVSLPSIPAVRTSPTRAPSRAELLPAPGPLDSAERAAPNPFFPALAGTSPDSLSDAVAALERALSGPAAPAELEAVRQVARDAIATAAQRIEAGLEADLSAYAAQRRVDADHPVASRVSALAGGVHAHPRRIEAAAEAARADLRDARMALATGDLAGAADALEGAEVGAGAVARAWREYAGGVVDGADAAVAGLEHTRNAAFVTLGVLSIVGSGGLAGGAAATAQFAARSQGLALGASLLATTGQAAAKASLGDPVDLGAVAKDVALDLVLTRFGGQLSNAMFRRLVGHPAVRSIGEVAFARIATSVLTHEAGTALRTAADAAYAKLTGRPVTWGEFVDTLAERLTDPKGVAIAALLGAVQAGADVRYGAPKSTLVIDENKKGGGQNNELDLVRNRQIIEDKSAHNLNNPGNARPQTPDEWAAKQIFKKTCAKLDLLRSSTAVSRARDTGSPDVPTMDQLRTLRQYRFDIEADSPALRAAVEKQMDALHAKYPDWTFSARFGAKRPADDRAP